VQAVRDFEESAADDATESIKKRLGGIWKISFAMKNRLRKAALKTPFKSAMELKRRCQISVLMIQHVLQKQLGLPPKSPC
jgi:hypothetical protein